MSIVTIDGQKTSTYDAILWASKEFGQSSFKVKNCFPDFKWQFEFTDSQQASLFALKWIR